MGTSAGWTLVDVRRAGPLRVRARFSASGALRREPSCRGGRAGPHAYGQPPGRGPLTADSIGFTVRTLPSRILPRGWPDLLRQILLFCGAYWLYRLVRGLTDGQAADAFAHARELIHLERDLGLFFEPSLHAWAEGKAWVIDAASWMYVNSHFTITTVTLAFIYLRRNASFYFVRNMFMVAMGDRARRLRGLPDRAAAAHAGVGLHGLRGGLHRRRRDLGLGGRAVQPLRRGARPCTWPSRSCSPSRWRG